MAGLHLKHIYKVYPGGVRAVNDFDLEIKDKSFVVLVGPSGCGKSTTLRMVAGLEAITSGQLFIDDTCVNDLESKDRDIAMVFQSYALYPHMTVFQNMGFGLKLRHEKPEIIKEKVMRAAEILEITDLLDRKPKELSGGQRQRVALGRAIVREPNVFLLDEPLSNLDAKLRVQMRTEITKLHEKLQTTFIYVTHDQTEAMTMGDTIVVMNKGYIQQADAPVTLFEDPTNLFVATFLGSPQMNIIKGKLIKDKKGVGFALEGNEKNIVPLRKETAAQIERSGLDLEKEYLFGIRPDQIGIAEKGGIPAQVEAVEQLGDETLIYALIEGHKGHIILKTPATAKVISGQEVNLDFHNERVYLFDPDTEYSLIGMPSFNKLPCKVRMDAGIPGVELGKSYLPLDDGYMQHVLDRATTEQAYLAIKPEHILLEGEEGVTVPLEVKVDFLEERTNYDIAYGVVDGLREYVIFRVPKDKKVAAGKNFTIHLPLDHINLCDEAEDALNAREVVYPNVAKVNVTTLKDGRRQVAIRGGQTLIFDEIPCLMNEGDDQTPYTPADGEYLMRLHQTGLEVVFDRKNAKSLGKEKVTPQKGTYLTISCYDEEPGKKANIIYGKIKGFEDYVTLEIPNDFSVYKMPEFKLLVPLEALSFEDIH